MVAGVDVAARFDHRNIAAGRPEKTEGMVLAKGGPGRFFEDLHLDGADIARPPLVEYGAEEGAEFLRRYGPVADPFSSGSTRGRKLRWVAPIDLKKRYTCRGNMTL